MINIVFLILLTSTSLFSELPRLPVLVRPNKSQIVGSVLSVKKSTFPEVEVTIRVLKSEDVPGFANLISTGTVLSATPIFVRDENGKVIFSDLSNIRNFVSYYLLPGDNIACEIKCVGDERGRKYLMNRIKRIR